MIFPSIPVDRQSESLWRGAAAPCSPSPWCIQTIFLPIYLCINHLPPFSASLTSSVVSGKTSVYLSSCLLLLSFQHTFSILHVLYYTTSHLKFQEFHESATLKVQYTAEKTRKKHDTRTSILVLTVNSLLLHFDIPILYFPSWFSDNSCTIIIILVFIIRLGREASVWWLGHSVSVFNKS